MLRFLFLSLVCNIKTAKLKYVRSVICKLGATNRFSKPSHVFYGGHVVGESAMNFLDDVGPEVIHGYEVCQAESDYYACFFIRYLIVDIQTAR